MTVAAGKIQGNLHRRQAAIRVELVNLGGVNRHAVCTDITSKFLRIAPGILNHLWHMAFNAVDPDSSVFAIVLHLGFLKMAICARDVCGCFVRLQLLHDPGVWIMTDNTIYHRMLPLGKITITVLMADETVYDFDCASGAKQVALLAHFSISVDHHPDTTRVAGV